MTVNNGETFANSKAQSVLSMELIKSLPNFLSFLKLVKAFCFQKGASIIYVNVSPKYIGKVATCQCYAMSQQIVVIKHVQQK